MGGMGGPSMGGGEGEIEGPMWSVDGNSFDGVTFNRKIDPYGENEEEDAKENEDGDGSTSSVPAPFDPDSEGWVAEILLPILLAEFPPQPDSKKLAYPLFLPQSPLGKGSTVARLVGCDQPDKEHATWKEWVVYRERKLVQIFRLVEHGRRMYRVLCYTSDSRYSLHSLPTNTSARSLLPPQVRRAAGNPRELSPPEPTLIAIRHKRIDDRHLYLKDAKVKESGGEQNGVTTVSELYLPSRLLQGIVPSALLEHFRFWQREDGLIYGEPLDPASQWFNYGLKVEMIRYEEERERERDGEREKEKERGGEKDGEGEAREGRCNGWGWHARITRINLTSTYLDDGGGQGEGENWTSTLLGPLKDRRGRGDGKGCGEEEEHLPLMAMRKLEGDEGFAKKKTKDSADANGPESHSHSSSSSVPIRYDDASIAQLISLGYSVPAAELALRKCQHNTSIAANWLLNEANLAEIISVDMRERENRESKEKLEGEERERQREREAVEMAMAAAISLGLEVEGLEKDHKKEGEGGSDGKLMRSLSGIPLKRTNTHLSRLKVLSSHEGYSKAAAEHALDAMGGDLALARAWLDDPRNDAEIEAIERGERRGKGGLENIVLEQGIDGKEGREEDREREKERREGNGQRGSSSSFQPCMTLINLLEDSEQLLDIGRGKANEDGGMERRKRRGKSPLFRLASMLSRIENLSHILVWGVREETEVRRLEIAAPRERLK